MMYYGNGMNGWGMVLMTVNSLMLWTLVIAGILAVVRYTGRDGRRGATVASHAPSPQQLLAERFARGEIDDEEYARRLGVLDTATPPSRPAG
ncbi:SHOCT domain-containing protein [Actinoplanes sp. CA-252034]|uniref:SHOCT domain-containing protein n=1 Tax=Actinoplanes sp. CA-252034 TaxID=3239906 RepID=UPI003D967D0E